MVIGNHDTDSARLRRSDHLPHRHRRSEFHIHKRRRRQEFCEQLARGRGKISDPALRRIPHRQQDRQLRIRGQLPYAGELFNERIHSDFQHIHIAPPERFRQPQTGLRMHCRDDKRHGKF